MTGIIFPWMEVYSERMDSKPHHARSKLLLLFHILTQWKCHKYQCDVNVANGVAIDIANDVLPSLVDGGGITRPFEPIKITVTYRIEIK